MHAWGGILSYPLVLIPVCMMQTVLWWKYQHPLGLRRMAPVLVLRLVGLLTLRPPWLCKSVPQNLLRDPEGGCSVWWSVQVLCVCEVCGCVRRRWSGSGWVQDSDHDGVVGIFVGHWCWSNIIYIRLRQHNFPYQDVIVLLCVITWSWNWFSPLGSLYVLLGLVAFRWNCQPFAVAPVKIRR